MTAANKRQIEYWSKSAARDWETANYLFCGKRYDACLFYCHLTLEKILKAHVVKTTQKLAPKIHDLRRLAELSRLDIDKDTMESLAAFNRFNIRARYPDIKFKFFLLATGDYAKDNMRKIKDIYEILCQKLKPKK